MCYSLEVPYWGTSNEYPQHVFDFSPKSYVVILIRSASQRLMRTHNMFLWRNKKNMSSVEKKVPNLELWITMYVFSLYRVLTRSMKVGVQKFIFCPGVPQCNFDKFVWKIGVATAKKDRQSGSVSNGRASALWPGGCGFSPRLSHTKVSCSFAWDTALRK